MRDDERRATKIFNDSKRSGPPSLGSSLAWRMKGRRCGAAATLVECGAHLGRAGTTPHPSAYACSFLFFLHVYSFFVVKNYGVPW